MMGKDKDKGRTAEQVYYELYFFKNSPYWGVQLSGKYGIWLNPEI
jgi:hypothetical protein